MVSKELQAAVDAAWAGIRDMDAQWDERRKHLAAMLELRGEHEDCPLPTGYQYGHPRMAHQLLTFAEVWPYGTGEATEADANAARDERDPPMEVKRSDVNGETDFDLLRALKVLEAQFPEAEFKMLGYADSRLFSVGRVKEQPGTEMILSTPWPIEEGSACTWREDADVPEQIVERSAGAFADPTSSSGASAESGEASQPPQADEPFSTPPFGTPSDEASDTEEPAS